MWYTVPYSNNNVNKTKQTEKYTIIHHSSWKVVWTMLSCQKSQSTYRQTCRRSWWGICWPLAILTVFVVAPLSQLKTSISTATARECTCTCIWKGGWRTSRVATQWYVINCDTIYSNVIERDGSGTTHLCPQQYHLFYRELTQPLPCAAWGRKPNKKQHFNRKCPNPEFVNRYLQRLCAWMWSQHNKQWLYLWHLLQILQTSDGAVKIWVFKRTLSLKWATFRYKGKGTKVQWQHPIEVGCSCVPPCILMQLSENWHSTVSWWWWPDFFP